MLPSPPKKIYPFNNVIATEEEVLDLIRHNLLIIKSCDPETTCEKWERMGDYMTYYAEHHGSKLRVIVENEETSKRIPKELEGVPIEMLIAPPSVPQ